MGIHCNCGHEVFSGNDMIPVEFDDEEIDHDAGCFVPVTITATYCPACAEEGIKAGRLRRVKGSGTESNINHTIEDGW